MFSLGDVLGLDIRDEMLWVRLAKKRILARRREAYGASLLPGMDVDAIRRELASLDDQIYAVENEEMIDDIEKLARARAAEVRKPKPPVKRRWKPKRAKAKRRI